MEFNKDASCISDDFYYDLFEGGYIKPEKLLKNESDIQKINEAIKTIEQFKKELEDNDIMEIM